MTTETTKTTKTTPAAESPIYQLADALTTLQLEAELAAATGVYADTVRKALGLTTRRALTATQYGARLAVARRILNRTR